MTIINPDPKKLYEVIINKGHQNSKTIICFLPKKYSIKNGESTWNDINGKDSYVDSKLNLSGRTLKMIINHNEIYVRRIDGLLIKLFEINSNLKDLDFNFEANYINETE